MPGRKHYLVCARRWWVACLITWSGHASCPAHFLWRHCACLPAYISSDGRVAVGVVFCRRTKAREGRSLSPSRRGLGGTPGRNLHGGGRRHSQTGERTARLPVRLAARRCVHVLGHAPCQDVDQYFLGGLMLGARQR